MGPPAMFIPPDVNTFASFIFFCVCHNLCFIPFRITMLLRFISLVLLLLFTTLVATALELKNCFAADGTPSDNLPCDPTANVSSCCGSTWICATNLYCRSRSDSAANFVGTCTDRTWKDPACPFIQNQLSPYFGSYTLSLAALLNTKQYIVPRTLGDLRICITPNYDPRADTVLLHRHQEHISLQPFQLYPQHNSLRRSHHLPFRWQYNLLRCR